MFYSYVKENVFAAVEIRYVRGRGRYHFSMKCLQKGTFAVKGVGYLSGSSHCKDLLSALPSPSLVTTIHCTLHNYEFITLLQCIDMHAVFLDNSMERQRFYMQPLTTTVSPSIIVDI